MAQRCKLLLDALGFVGLRLDLDPGRNMQRLDVEEVLDPGSSSLRFAISSASRIACPVLETCFDRRPSP
jgi:hypothetical protein